MTPKAPIHTRITSATFIKGAVDEDTLIKDGQPQIAFIGRSNVGKSSLINALTKNNKLARTSATAGRTQEINFMHINSAFYFVDLPGYGYARGSFEKRGLIAERIEGYLFDSGIKQYKIVLIVDANVGMTDSDKEMLKDLRKHHKNVVIIANKIDKPNQSTKQKNLNAITKEAGSYHVIPFSSVEHRGIEEVLEEILP